VEDLANNMKNVKRIEEDVVPSILREIENMQNITKEVSLYCIALFLFLVDELSCDRCSLFQKKKLKYTRRFAVQRRV